MNFDNNLKDIIYEDITDEYCLGKYGEFEVIIMKRNGYINATKLCQQGGKQLFHWMELDCARNICKEVSSILITDIHSLKIIIFGGSGNSKRISGSYLHPMLITHVAMWISAKFAALVSSWIKNWKRISTSNDDAYFKSLLSVKASPSNNEECDVVDWSCDSVYKNSCREVETKFGRVDILSPKEIIEVKALPNYKHAIGQIIVYSNCFPSHLRKLVLFYNVDDDDDNYKQLIRDVCISLDIVCDFVSFKTIDEKIGEMVYYSQPDIKAININDDKITKKQCYKNFVYKDTKRT
jgi:hypothetical protein